MGDRERSRGILVYLKSAELLSPVPHICLPSADVGLFCCAKPPEVPSPLLTTNDCRLPAACPCGADALSALGFRVPDDQRLTTDSDRCRKPPRLGRRLQP